jgi:hypothetical protein
LQGDKSALGTGSFDQDGEAFGWDLFGCVHVGALA